MSVENSLLGLNTIYPTQYAPELLFPIARAPAREKLAHAQGIPQGLSQGLDWWHVFELSWLDANHVPQVAIGRLTVPANSLNLIESKSLKLYFNSLNFQVFADRDKLIQTVQSDLSAAAQGAVQLQLFDVNALGVDAPFGECIDAIQPTRIATHPDATLLQFDVQTQTGEYLIHSHLLRSNCPVTNQPDWGTLFIRYQGKKPCYAGLIAYIISYRQHNGFHEQCVEQIYADVWHQLQPEKLMVYATYTRRGGLDINPCRVSHESWLPSPIRLARQ